ncbi:MAG TPA: hypothetical protein VJ996_02500 [Solirubrobacteraceae bacterium]|nr:hypothetical protein [Solirubrobacteraceae bacterium]
MASGPGNDRGGHGGTHRADVNWDCPGNRPPGQDARRRLLHARSGHAAHALLEIGGALRGTTGPFAQPLQLARLGKEQQ